MKTVFTHLKVKLSLAGFLFLFMLTVNSVFSQPTSQTFNSSGTYTIPSGYSASITIEVWGGGGGGGVKSAGAKGGGGSGAYAAKDTLLPAGTYTVTVGAGGTAAVNGGISSFTTFVVAAGGTAASGTTGGAGGTIAASTGARLYAGGNGANASGNNGGGGGGSAFSNANGGNATGSTGGTGHGNGGNGGPGSNNSGASGVTPGAGGGGKAGPGNSSSSGTGANGQVVVTVTGVLPVKFGNIKAIEKQNGIEIEWKVYSEENVNRYQVERSMNGITFSALGDVPARNVNIATNYYFFDANPLPGLSFYRLKSIDIDGKYGYSTIIRVNLNKQVKDISLYPNPVKGEFVSFQAAGLSKGDYKIQIFNSNGMRVLEQGLTHSGGSINQTLKLPAGISPGFYFLQMINDEMKGMNKSFIISK